MTVRTEDQVDMMMILLMMQEMQKNIEHLMKKHVNSRRKKLWLSHPERKDQRRVPCE